MFSFKVFLLFVVFTQICFSADTEFTAYCDLVKLVNPSSTCPADLSCEGASFVKYDGVVGTCKNSHITALKASNVGLKSVPKTLNNMIYLDMLNLGKNELTELPALGSLTKLTTLYLNNNKLTKITGIFNSTKLASVNLASNALTELPPEWGNTSITSLVFDGNNIAEIPLEYKKLKLSYVGMADNNLDCSKVSQDFPGTEFEESCIQAQQKTDDNDPPLPTSFSTEPPYEGLDGYEIASIILFVIFVIGTVVAVVLYIRYRNGGIDA